MAAPFVVESTTPGTQVWSVDAAGNTVQSGNLTVAGTTFATGPTALGTVTSLTTTGVITQNNGINSSGSISYLNATIGAGGNALLGTAASGTALSDVSRDYMVYLTSVGGSAAGTVTIGTGANATQCFATLYANATIGTGFSYSFRLPAGWFIRAQATVAFLQTAVSC